MERGGVEPATLLAKLSIILDNIQKISPSLLRSHLINLMNLMNYCALIFLSIRKFLYFCIVKRECGQ